VIVARGSLENALLDLIRGDGVRRASHGLEIDGRDVSDLFLTLLKSEGYLDCRIDDIDVQPGERTPAFYVSGGKAHFGWVFWEIFSPDRKRKLFGSQVRNDKGDWAIMLSRNARVHTCMARKELMDTDRPSSL
jgi:hypothetical protein